MPTNLNGKTYLQTNEAACEIGVSRQTLLRWFRDGLVSDVKRDARGWRIFTKKDIARIRKWSLTRANDDN